MRMNAKWYKSQLTLESAGFFVGMNRARLNPSGGCTQRRRKAELFQRRNPLYLLTWCSIEDRIDGVF
jgi:hypothetical protein